MRGWGSPPPVLWDQFRPVFEKADSQPGTTQRLRQTQLSNFMQASRGGSQEGSEGSTGGEL